MTQQSLEATVAVMNEQLRTIISDNAEARQSRKEMHQQIEAQNRVLDGIAARVANVESFVAGAGPTLQEYREMRLKVQGAGALGRWLWFAGGVLISFAAWASGILNKLTGH